MKRAESTTSASLPTAAGASLKILCADDDASLGTMLSFALVRHGHTVVVAKDGREALEKIAAERSGFDLVVTDNEMPNADGFALVQRLRDSKYPGKIIVHCSELRPSDAARYRKLGVDLILQKPVPLIAFLNAVHEVGGVAQ